jgi:Mn-dependent DtxR family transcriptional regulator
VLIDEERIVLHRVPRKGKGHLKSSDISTEFPKARYVLRRLYDNGYVNRKLVGNVYGYFLTDKGERETGG